MKNILATLALTATALLPAAPARAQTLADLNANADAQLGVTRDFLKNTTAQLATLKADTEFEHYDYVLKKKATLERMEKALLGLEQFYAGEYSRELKALISRHAAIQGSAQYTAAQKEALLKNLAADFQTVVSSRLRPALQLQLLNVIASVCSNCVVRGGNHVTVSIKGYEDRYAYLYSYGEEIRESDLAFDLSRPGSQYPQSMAGIAFSSTEVPVIGASGCATQSCMVLSWADLLAFVRKVDADFNVAIKAGPFEEKISSGYSRDFLNLYGLHQELTRLEPKLNALAAGLPYAMTRKEYESSGVELAAAQTQRLAATYRKAVQGYVEWIVSGQRVVSSNPIDSQQEYEAVVRNIDATLDWLCQRPNIPGGAFCLRTQAQKQELARYVLERAPKDKRWQKDAKKVAEYIEKFYQAP